MQIKTESQYREAVKKYLQLCEYPEGTQEFNEAVLLNKAMNLYENAQLLGEKHNEIVRDIGQN